MAFSLYHLLDYKQEEYNLWHVKIKEWLEANWPRGSQFIHPSISNEFVKIAIYMGDDFDEVERTLSSMGLFTTSDEIGILLDDLHKSGIPKKFPSETLDLLSKVCPECSHYSLHSPFSLKRILQNILLNISKNNPQILDNSIYKEVDELHKDKK